MQAWIEILLRSIALFFVTLFFIRIMSRRNITQTTPFNFVNYIVIAVIASLMSVGIIANLVFGFIALSIWIIFSIALDYLTIRSKWVHDWVNGKETVLIKHGKIMEQNLLETRITAEELLRDLRSKNIFNLTDVEFAVMESTGEINAFLKADKKPVTAYDLGKKAAPRAEPQTVILDGNMLDESLASLGLNREWLKMQLGKIGVSIDNVFLGQVDSFGDLYIDLYDDSIVIPQPKVKEMLYATLQKSQADLMAFALQTKDQSAKSMYSENADKLGQLMRKIEPYLLR